jgi:predicted acyltransferase (DUF342 family)
MAVNKNFVVKNGLEVNSQLIFADATSNKVGIASTQPNVELDVRGGIAATNITLSGVSTVGQELRVGSGIAGTVFTVLDAGNVVGVGTSQPAYLLDVRSPGTGTTALYVQGDARITGDITLDDIFADYVEITHTAVSAASTFNGNLDINADVDVNRSVSITGGATVTGLSTFSSNVDINESLVVVGGIGVTGIGTVNAVKIFNDGNIGIITANDPSGIVTYYGDGQFLTNIQSGVGIATTNPSTGYSEIVGLGATIITFAGPGVSTNAQYNGGTGVTVNPASGIATVYLAGGGSGGGYQTTIVRDSSTVGAGGSDIFTSSSPYISGYINVYVNGSKLNSADFTETDGTAGTITLSSAALEGDIVELENFEVVAITGEFETLITKEEYTVTTASQTVFDLGSTYRSGYIDVYLNGVRLSSGDYTETDSDTVTLSTAATYGDIVEFVNYESRAISEVQPVWRNDGTGAGSGGIYTFTSVGVGTSAQTSFFEVYGSAQIRTGVVTITNSSDTDIVRITDGGFNVISGITTLGGNLVVSGDLDVSGITTLGGNLVVSGDLDINGTGTHDIFGTVSLDNVAVAGIVTAVDFNSTSDQSLKTNINTVNNALDIVNELRGVSFDWKETGKPSYGVIAQELEKVLPALVSDTNIKSVNYNGIIGVLIESIKELSEEIEKLKNDK